MIAVIEKMLDIKCKCGGELKQSFSQVEFFGIDFGARKVEVCMKCGEEYLDEKTLGEIEKEVKKKKIFGLEQKVRVTKSGNSLVIRIPPAIAKFAGTKYQDWASIFPVDKKKIEIQFA